MSYLGSDSKSTSGTLQQGVSDQGFLAYLYKSAANFLYPGSTQISGSTIKSGIDINALLGGKVDFDLTVTDPKLIEAVVKETGNQIKTVGDTFSASLSQAQEEALAKLSELAETKLTEGENKRDKTILWIVLGGIAGLAFILWRGR